MAPMDIGRYLSVKRPARDSASNRSAQSRKHIPLIASPVDPRAFQALSTYYSKKDKSEEPRANFLPDNSHGDPVLYKHHHEASTIELFYDLFFVGNLAVFTTMHHHTDAQSTKNYLGFFTLLWFTWLSTTLFDVRFTTDSVLNRVFKAIHFGVMTVFIYAGPVFDQYDKASDAKSYSGFALALMASRLVLAIQYSIVLWQSRRYKRAILPLALTAGTNLAAAIVFLITHFVFPIGSVPWHTLLLWYLVSIAEGLATMAIAIFSRVLSFKDSNLVERVGLLTLIVLGEGIIGMIKSVSCITKSAISNNAEEIGTVIAAILLIYLIWMLYFDQIDHERFGAVRQQIWALFHYPLHMAILLTVEGSTALIVWNSTVQGLNLVWSRRPLDMNAPGAGFPTSEAFITHLNDSMWMYNNFFKSESLILKYDWNQNLTALQNVSATNQFNSPQWNAAAEPIVRRMFNGASNFVIQVHSAMMSTMLTVMPSGTDFAQLQAVFDVFDVVVLFFYIAAGVALLLLAVMYWFGKMHKSKSELGEIVGRIVIGFVLPFIGLTGVFTNKTTSGFKFVGSNWLVPSVVIGYFAVLAVDNVLLALSHHSAKKRSHYDSNAFSVNARDVENASLVASSIYEIPDQVPPRYQSPQFNQDQFPQDLKPRSGTPVPGAKAESVRIPVAMVMDNGFQPSHRPNHAARGYAAVDTDDNGGSDNDSVQSNWYQR